MPRRIKLVLEYDGSDFSGWQVQGGGPPGESPPGAVRTVQGALERALKAVLGAPVRVAGAGRTDEGVHAIGQVASFDQPDEAKVPIDQLPSALNAHLPPDCSVVTAEVTHPDFHARHSAKSKLYRYSILNRRERSAVLERTHWLVRQPLNLDNMRTAAAMLVGTHDFAAFSAELSAIQEKRAEQGKEELSTVREIRELRIANCELRNEIPSTVFNMPISIDIEASGFLYKMARSIAGSLVEVGRGKHPPGWIAEVLASKDRRRAGPTAPAKGLCLVRVTY